MRDDPPEVGALPVALVQPAQRGVQPPVPLGEFAGPGGGSRQLGGEYRVGHRVNRGEVQVAEERIGGCPDARLLSHWVADAGYQVKEAALRSRVHDLDGIQPRLGHRGAMDLVLCERHLIVPLLRPDGPVMPAGGTSAHPARVDATALSLHSYGEFPVPADVGDLDAAPVARIFSGLDLGRAAWT